MFPGDAMFTFAPIFIGIIFVIVIGSIIVNAIKGVGQWKKNEESPRLTVPAVVKTKRSDVRRRTNHHDNHHHHSSTTIYYVTFEFDSGDRTEFKISGSEYGQLAEGDSGKLTFQGTRYLGFERNYEPSL
ncbi:DUF2500 domain-containing protein [Fredinandcohnia quinoae]|uniref:DUF2500 domain-containing protein n=1 Tax=Fredinandcohnia quinoae TaxID=2918902 RepID=A0AAW5DYA3_9BACI|nr:DUF2500 domain-containing protein [Fredinandcohnia sp. SECRCQ15]MCH1624299.1 DUF2500 domain-containing protein [Fredinandcohnia sp. SECRCQ15]